MTENDFEGSLVLEKLAEAGTIDEFYAAIDADDFDKAGKLMRRAGVDVDTIRIVLRKMSDADSKH